MLLMHIFRPTISEINWRLFHVSNKNSGSVAVTKGSFGTEDTEVNDWQNYSNGSTACFFRHTERKNEKVVSDNLELETASSVTRGGRHSNI